MKTLNQQQQDFAQYLLKSEEILMISDVVDTAPFHASKRLKVYHDGYRLRLHEVLQTDYPKVEALLGESDFFELCMKYIEANPSHAFSVRPFGAGFSYFLKTQPFHPFLAEMADFEWALMDSLDAGDAPCFTLDDLKTIPAEEWGDLALTFHPSVHRSTYEWDTPSLWKDIEQDCEARAPIQNEAPQQWIFWRKDLLSMFASMNPVQRILYQGFQDNLSLAELAEVMESFYEPNDIPNLLVQNLQHWISEGLFCN